MDVYEYYDGRCSICGEDTRVRHKNIWLTGSEGTDMCWPCEKAMLDFLNERKRHFFHMKLVRLKEKKKKLKGV
jgi:hypothetical protein